MSPNRTIPLCRYHYDSLDRLVASTSLTQGNAQRFYKKDRITTEVQGAVRRSIMHYDDQLLAQHEHQIDTVETRLFATDPQRTVLNVLDTVQHYPLAYTAYGHRPPESGLFSLLGFNGERPDSLTGCYLLGNGYRAFNPVLMRFNSPDGWSPFGAGGLNSYAYCSADPVNRADPSGHAGWAVLRIVFKFLRKRPAREVTILNRSKGLPVLSTSSGATKRMLSGAGEKYVPISKVARVPIPDPPPAHPRISQNPMANQPIEPVNAVSQSGTNSSSSIPMAHNRTAVPQDDFNRAQTISNLRDWGYSDADIVNFIRRAPELTVEMPGTGEIMRNLPRRRRRRR